MVIELKDLKKGDLVWCGCSSGFCHDTFEKVKDILIKYDENTGEKYNVISLKENRLFDSRDGNALNPPIAYYLQPAENH